MDWARAAFTENTRLTHSEAVKVFSFLLKTVAAVAYLSVLGYLAAGGTVSGLIWFILFAGSLFDLLPLTYLPGPNDHLPAPAQQMEWAHLILKVVAYIYLVSIFTIGLSIDLFTAYAVFCLIWITSFLLEQSVLFLLRGRDTDAENV